MQNQYTKANKSKTPSQSFFSPTRNSQPGPELWFTSQSEEVMFPLVFGRGTFFTKPASLNQT